MKKRQRKWYLMRHGETDYNRERRFYGSQDVSINSRGKKQAHLLAEQMKSYTLSKIYTSELKRAKETARIAFPKQDFQTLSGLNERDFGLWEGLVADEIEARFPMIWKKWLESPFEITPPQAERFSTFQQRVDQAVENLLHTSEDSAIVAHLGVLRLMYQRLVDQTADFWQIDIPQGEVLVLTEDMSGIWHPSYLERGEQ